MRKPLDSPNMADTIVAVATPPGRGGIGIVRLSGPEAVGVAERLVRLVGGGGLGEKEFHARARRAVVVDPAALTDSRDTGVSPLRIAKSRDASVEMTSIEAGVIDEALVTVFHAPNSYTGEDVVEIAAHGSPVVMEALVRGALASGAKAPLSPNEAMRPWAEAQGYPNFAIRTDAEKAENSKTVPFKANAAKVENSKPAPFKTARLAAPGEFTQRAFLAGRIDLTQAEAVGDLIAAQTLEQARAAAQQLGGALSRRVAPAKEALLHLIALLEAGMDFASGELDDVDVVAPQQIATAVENARAPLQTLADSFRRGQLLRHGAAIALVGRPNAGKSSLFNRLLERERAIVTPLPGTTRDTVEESLALGGVPVRLVDTAGIRLGEQAVDEAERQGIVRSREALADADLVLLVRDASLAVEQDELALMEELRGRPHLVVENKCDLLAGSGAKAPVFGAADRGLKPAATPGLHHIPGHNEMPDINERPGVEVGAANREVEVRKGVEVGFSPPCASRNEGALAPAIATSALTGEGIDTLREAILRELGAAGSLAEGGLLNNLRQQEAVAATLSALAAAADANQAALPHEIILLELHNALRSLDSLTGETTTDDILGRIFATFCIGK